GTVRGSEGHRGQTHATPKGEIRMSAIFDREPKGYVQPTVTLTEEEKAKIEEAVKNHKWEFADIIEEPSVVITPAPVISIATALYAQEVSKPVPVNADSLPDYQQIAKDCVERAKETAPYLLRELGLLPQEEA